MYVISVERGNTDSNRGDVRSKNKSAVGSATNMVSQDKNGVLVILSNERGKRMRLGRLLVIVLALLAAGCASATKAAVKNIDWGSRMGTYTYDEALAELGEPDVIGQSAEGMIAEWSLWRSPAVSIGFGFGDRRTSPKT